MSVSSQLAQGYHYPWVYVVSYLGNSGPSRKHKFEPQIQVWHAYYGYSFSVSLTQILGPNIQASCHFPS